MKRAGFGAVLALAGLLLPAVIHPSCPPIDGWTADFAGVDGGLDWANAVAVDSSGNVIVVGSETNAVTGLDWKIIKYDSAGNLLYEAYYDGAESLDDGATGVAVDSAGNIWVSGY